MKTFLAQHFWVLVLILTFSVFGAIVFFAWLSMVIDEVVISLSKRYRVWRGKDEASDALDRMN